MFSYICKACNKETETPQIETVPVPPIGQQVILICPSCHEAMMEAVAHCDICKAVIPGMERYVVFRDNVVFCCEACGGVV